VKSVTISPVSAGKHSATLKAPTKKGNYKLIVIAKLSCGKQTVKQNLKVH